VLQLHTIISSCDCCLDDVFMDDNDDDIFLSDALNAEHNVSPMLSLTLSRVTGLAVKLSRLHSYHL